MPASRLLPSPGKLVQSVLGEQGAGAAEVLLGHWATPLSSPALAISLCLFQASSPHSICHLLSSKGPRVLLRCRQALSLPACRLDAADRAEVQGGRPGPPCLIQWPPAINGVVGLRVFGLPLLQRPRFMLVKTRPLCRSVSEFAARLCAQAAFVSFRKFHFCLDLFSGVPGTGDLACAKPLPSLVDPPATLNSTRDGQPSCSHPACASRSPTFLLARA